MKKSKLIKVNPNPYATMSDEDLWRITYGKKNSIKQVRVAFRELRDRSLRGKLTKARSARPTPLTKKEPAKRILYSVENPRILFKKPQTRTNPLPNSVRRRLR